MLRYHKDGAVHRVDGQGNQKYLYALPFRNKVKERCHRSASLKVLAFSDCRSQDISSVIEYIQDCPKPDLILYGADDAHRFRAGGRNFFEEIAALSRYRLCAVRGNDDEVASQHITGKLVYDVHTTALALDPFAVS